MLQNYCNEYENIETEICNIRQLQRKARFVLDNVRLEEEDLCERFKNMHLNYEACIKISSYEDPNETIRIKINELTTQKKNLLEELIQLRKKADDNTKKLACVKAMIAEQEVIISILAHLKCTCNYYKKNFRCFVGKERDRDSKIKGDFQERRIHFARYKETDRHCFEKSGNK